MKKLILIALLVTSLPSYADWTEIGSDGSVRYHIDFDKIRNVDGYVYYWTLGDFLKPMGGYLSYKHYYQGDCKLIQLKLLNAFYHKEPMGDGSGLQSSPEGGNADWKFPPTESVNGVNLQYVCLWVRLSPQRQGRLLEKLTN